METRKHLIVGLGNPGRRHRDNRHNVGFVVLERLAATHGIAFNRLQLKAYTGEGLIAGLPAILAKPQTFMNLSGESIGPLSRFYRIDAAQMLVVYDELDLPLGTIRLREKGGAGGHNGMKSIIQHMGPDFPRLRVGIGRPEGRLPPAAYVLQDFSPDDLPVVSESIARAVSAIETYLTEGIEKAMSLHNGPAGPILD